MAEAARSLEIRVNMIGRWIKERHRQMIMVRHYEAMGS